MNVQAIMKQAQMMQKKITQAQEELESMTFEGKTSLVEVEIFGTGKVSKVVINKDEDLTKDNIEIVEDMIVLAMNEAIEKMKVEKEKKLGAHTQGMTGLF